MPRVFRQQYTRPIPPDAQRVTHKGKPAVKFKGPDGKAVVAPLTKKGDRCRVASPLWYGQYLDEKRRAPLCANKTAAEQMLNEEVKKVELGRAGVRDPHEADRKRPLAEHLADYRSHLDAKDGNPRHVSQVVAHCEAVFDGIGARFVPELAAGRVESWLSDRRREGMGVSTSNHYLTSVKGFTRWLSGGDPPRWACDPLRSLTRLDDNADVRRRDGRTTPIR